jgi:hypothetical protein
MRRVNESPKVRQTPWATSKATKAGSQLSFDIITRCEPFAYIKLQFISRGDVLAPTARKVLMPMIVAVHRIALHDRPHAQALLRAIVVAADCPSFAGGAR